MNHLYIPLFEKKQTAKTGNDFSFFIKGIYLRWNDRGLTHLEFCKKNPKIPETQTVLSQPKFVVKAAQWLESYFNKKKMCPFPNTYLDLSSASSFEQRVWNYLLTIPHGEIMTYGQMARNLGQPKAARAMGQANKRNPLPLLIPCHRIVAAQGKLGGYACGVRLKKKLLQHEKVSR